MTESPCINLCILVDGYCQGCHRSKEEIATWMWLSDEEKQVVLGEVALRQQKPMRNPYDEL